MSRWIIAGLRAGVRSTKYPADAERSPGTTPGRPRATPVPADQAGTLAGRCPTAALQASGDAVHIDWRRCVHCRRCTPHAEHPGLRWDADYEWAGREVDTASPRLERAFGRSLHLRFIDAGACGACVSEARHLNDPYYNMHRLGFFVTASPRKADVLLVAGPVSDAMRDPLCRAYQAMPAPRRVVAMGACALSGGVFGPGFAAGAGVGEVLPVDVSVPGCPPPPLALLHALLVLVERKPPSALGEEPAPGGATG